MKTKRLFALVMAVLLLVFTMFGCADTSTFRDDDDDDDDRPSGNKPNNSQTSQIQAGKVADELDVDAATRLPDAVVPDPYFWSGKTIEYKSEPSTGGEEQYFYYTGEMTTIQAYVAMLQNNGFTMVGEYEGYKGAMYYWSFTCNAATGIPMIYDSITEKNCHLSIGWSSSSRLKYTFRISKDLPVWDTGLRMDGTVEDITYVAPSLGAGLNRNSDGSYSTTDGRLSTAVGSAAILRDGVLYNATTTYDERGVKQHVYVENFYRNEHIYLQFQMDTLQAGDLFSHLQMRDWILTAHESNDEDGFVYDTPFAMFLFHDGMMRRPGYNDAYFETASVRVMYYEKGKEAVFYVYGKMIGSGEPKEIEALIAVDMSKILSAGNADQGSEGGSGSGIVGSDGVYVPDHSKLDCLTCRGSGDCTSCGGSGYTYFGDYKTACTRCHKSGNCSSCGGSGKR